MVAKDTEPIFGLPLNQVLLFHRLEAIVAKRLWILARSHVEILQALNRVYEGIISIVKSG